MGNKDSKAKVEEKKKKSGEAVGRGFVQVTRNGRWRFAKIMRSTVSKWSGTLLGEDMGDTFN